MNLSEAQSARRRGGSRRSRTSTLARATLHSIALGAAGLLIPACGAPPAAISGDLSGVSAVSGVSWVKRLGLAVEHTALGRMGGQNSPPPSGRREPSLAIDARQPFTLADSDLYRLNCQACHGPDGTGSPPEINSLIGPVQGTSAAWLAQEFRKKDRPVDEAFLKEVAASAEGDLRTRLEKGGEKMPPFDHLQAGEVDALLGYLRRLAGVPGAGPTDQLLTEPAAGVGEHLVKGTCRICHDATGPGVGRMMMGGGTIPSLASLGAEAAVVEIVAKVRNGSSRMMMPMMPVMGQSRMPVFSYLTPAEISAALVYLAAYPPKP